MSKDLTFSSTGERVRYIRKLMGVTREEMQSRYGIKKPTIQKWEDDLTRIRPDNARRLVQAARSIGIYCTLDWILFGKGNLPHTFEQSTPNDAKDPDTQFLKMSQALQTIYPQCMSLVVDDIFMVPDFSPGDYVFGIPQTLEQIRSLLDYPFIVETTDGKKRLRRITIHKGAYHLYATNFGVKKTAPLELSVDIASAALVIWRYTHVPYA